MQNLKFVKAISVACAYVLLSTSFGIIIRDVDHMIGAYTFEGANRTIKLSWSDPFGDPHPHFS